MMNLELIQNSEKDIVKKIWQTIKDGKERNCVSLLIYYKKGFMLATECGKHIYQYAYYGDAKKKSAIIGIARMKYGIKKSEVAMIVNEAILLFKEL